MNINRHNYETFFLMYVDNELSATEKEAVNVFVKANPDLKFELDTLQQTVLSNPLICFDNKAGLLKPETNVTNEQLLLLLDNELNETDTRLLRDAISKYTFVAANWQSLQSVKLEAENISFPDKKSLYRREPARLVPIWFTRVAVAASIIGIVLFAGNRAGLFNQKPLEDVSSVTKPSSLPGTAQPLNEAKAGLSSTVPSNEYVVKQVDQELLPETVRKVSANENKRSALKNNSVNTIAIDKRNEPSSIVKTKNQYLENINNGTSNKNISPNVTKENGPERLEKLNPNDVAQNKLPDELATPLSMPDVEIRPLPANEIGTMAMFASQNEVSDDKIFLLDKEKVDRSKVGVMFRKIKRTIERKANIKSGKSIKIAGFEIAAR